MGAGASLERESPTTARKRAAGKIRDSLFLAQRDMRRYRDMRRRSTITLRAIEEKTSSSKIKKRRVSLIDQRVIDSAKGILRDEAFSSISIEKKRRPSNLCVVREKEERRESFGELMLNMLTQEWTGRISRENSYRVDDKHKKSSFEDLLCAHDKREGSMRNLRDETLGNVRRILWDEVNESPAKQPHKSVPERRKSLLLAAQRSARRRRESFQKCDDDRKIDSSPVHKAARRSSIRRFGSRKGSMNSLRRLSKIAMSRSTRSLLGRVSSSESLCNEDSKS